MKKYFLGILAIVMAVGFSAFTISGNNKEESTQKFTDFYYFGVISDIESGNLSSADTEFLEHNTTGNEPSYPCGGSRYVCKIVITNPNLVEPDGEGGYMIIGPTSSYSALAHKGSFK